MKAYIDNILNEGFMQADIGAILQVYREFSRGLGAAEINSKLLDRAITGLLRYYSEYVEWNKKFRRNDQFTGSELDRKVKKEYLQRRNELEDAFKSFDNNQKLIAIDNAINQLHIDYPMLRHIGFELYELEDDDPEEYSQASAQLDELIDTLEKLLKAQGKKLPEGGYGLGEKPRRIVSEMAIPRHSDLNKKYYHGTNKESAGMSILKNGIQVPDLTGRKGKMTPRRGKVYISPYLSYAQTYAIGGDVAGSDRIPSDIETNRYGFVFVIDGKELKDIEPDEDNIGELIYTIYTKIQDIRDLPYNYDKEMYSSLQITDEENMFYHKCKSILTPIQFNNVIKGEYKDWSAAGKKIIPRLTPDEHLWLIDRPHVHIAHHGPLFPKEAWKIDLRRIKELKRDASNFFQIAERVK